MRNTLEEEITKYLETNKEYVGKEKMSWNEGGELYRLYLKNDEKTLFATSLEKHQFRLIERYKNIFDYCKEKNTEMIHCEKLDIIEDSEKQVSYVFIIMEKITPIINLILDEEYVEKNESSNMKKMKLLDNVLSAGENIYVVSREFPFVNIYINNEEICIDENGKAKLQLMDMVKNEIEINNYGFELKRFAEQMAKGLNVELNIKLREPNIDNFMQALREEKSKTEEIEEGNRQILEKNLEEGKDKNPRALTNLGYMYEKGRGTMVDYQKAMGYYQKACELKYAPAFNNIAHMYQKGYGVEKSYEKAITYLEKAAKLKDNVAQFNLGMAYHKGKGVEKNMEKAAYWYKRAAKKGNAAAQIMCSRMTNEKKN